MREPTAAELAKHHTAIARLRAELFRKRTPADCFIVPGSEKILPPYIDGRTSEGRRLCLGGLEWRAESPRPGFWYEISVEHDSRDDFVVFLVVHGAQRCYTRFAMRRQFADLQTAFYRAIDWSREEDAKFLPTPTPDSALARN